ncbi:MAG: efflux RND transporter periplasmic adaptor subunit [Magnetococcales bacterium]|nr:efflux RND transporter periplasmic adaptor subunit [Magnetococcales bacterium]NGZ26468.1 efflux RND transporter periplasmic adaptor subunit [Magnetococcales bacterium]
MSIKQGGLLLLALSLWAAPLWAETVDHSAHAPSPASKGSARKILYYRNPMGLPDTSPVPKKDGMGMDYIPVYADEVATAGSGAVKIALDKVQKLGVKTEEVALRPVTRTIRAVGTVQVDERKLHIVSPKYEGWIEKLHADATGQSVKKGQTLMEVYSPALVLAQQEYLAAHRAEARLKDADQETRLMAGELAESALSRLRNWDIGDEQIKRLRNQGKANKSLSIISPVSGVILEKSAIQGMRFVPGEMLYRIADLSTVWVLADVFEQDMGMVREGQAAEVTLSAMPGKIFHGRVGFVYPTLTSETRTVKVRIEMPNPDGTLRPALYATVQLAAPTGNSKVMTVADSAVLDSGTRQVVLVERGEGLYEPRPVRIGSKGGGYVEILDGVKVGEKVVVRANFLIDAEANLKAALGHFAH